MIIKECITKCVPIPENSGFVVMLLWWQNPNKGAGYGNRVKKKKKLSTPCILASKTCIVKGSTSKDKTGEPLFLCILFVETLYLHVPASCLLRLSLSECSTQFLFNISPVVWAVFIQQRYSTEIYSSLKITVWGLWAVAKKMYKKKTAFKKLKNTVISATFNSSSYNILPSGLFYKESTEKISSQAL